MGVPKFFRYISERYPCLSELVRTHQVPDFDNLYLDMNGIVHTCTHPDDSKVNNALTEDEMFLAIFRYTEYIFQVIKPRKVFFLAIDGVAPRAKMNQQRSRRFRTAKDAENLEKEAKSKGETIDPDRHFDSNCITPGTVFMVRLQAALEFFIQRQISTKETWRKCKVILSGHNTPGEGEHKIMDYIRYIKSQPKYDPNTTHCLYGLDADLIMLGCSTHEMHISLLREEVRFGKDNDKKTSFPSHTRFYLLHLGILKEYLELEFSPVKNKMDFPFNIENIVDDWILMSFLVGNDFIPPLPNLHINNNALPLLYNAYMEVLPSLGGYINENGMLNLKRFEIFLRRLDQEEKELFKEKMSDLKYVNSKMECFEAEPQPEFNFDQEMSDMVRASNEMYMDDIPSDDESEDAMFDREFTMHKRNYYITKMGYPEMNRDVLEEQSECYVRAIQWVLYYYYRGVPSWGWYYPHHYAPFISDVRDFSHFKIDFDMGSPFKPFEQLLGVLPPRSRTLLPAAYRELMTEDSSPIIDYYPGQFETDLNGKRQDWEALVLIPFINEGRLLAAMRPCEANLTDAEKTRNSHGPMTVFEFDSESQGQMEGILDLPMVANVYCKTTLVDLSQIRVPPEQMVFGPPKGALTDVYFPGFPTMKYLEYTGKLESIRVQVFEMPSRNDTMVLRIRQKEEDRHKSVEEVYNDLIDKEVFVGWPHLTLAKVVGVSDDSSCKAKFKANESTEVKKFSNYSKSIVEHNKTRMGIDLGGVKVLIHVNLVKCMNYVLSNSGKLKLNIVWDEVKFVFPYQTTVKDISSYNKTFVMYKTVDEVYPTNSTVFLLSTQYYGSQGQVLDTSMLEKTQRIKISINCYPEPNFNPIFRLHQKCIMDDRHEYLTIHQACAEIGISKNALNRITGQVFVIPGKVRQVNERAEQKVNIGLQMRLLKTNKELPGYTKKVDYNWFVSREAVQIICEYLDRYPNICQALAKNEKNIYEEDLTDDGEVNKGLLDEIAKYIKTLPHNAVRPRDIGSKYVDKKVAEAIENAVQKTKDNPSYKVVTMQIKLHLLFRPGSIISPKCPDSRAEFSLFDRVVVVSSSSSVPIGSKGTIVAIVGEKNENPVKMENKDLVNYLYEVLFDDVVPDGLPYMDEIAMNKVDLIPEQDLINITYGRGLRDNQKEIELDANYVSKENVVPFKREQQNRNGAGSAKKSVPEKKKSTNNEEKTKLNDIWNKLISEGPKLKEPPPPNPPPVVASSVPVEMETNLTESLKKCLKISGEKEKKNAVPDVVTPSPAQLPKPPSNWRVEAQIDHLHKSTVSSSAPPSLPPPPFGQPVIRPEGMPLRQPFPPQQTGFFPQGMPFPRNNFPVMRPMMPYPNQQPRVLFNQPPPHPVPYHQNNSPWWNGNLNNNGQRFIPRNNYNYSMGPKGPQNLRNSNQQGAFIPLQAARKNTKGRNQDNPLPPQQQQRAEQNAASKSDSSERKEKNKSLNKSPKKEPEEKQQNKTKKPAPQKQPKPRKMAANFSLA